MRRILTTLCVVSLAACSAPEHQNKFDPGTPPALQARATLTGTLSLEAEGAAPPSLAGVEVSVPSVGQVTTDETGAWSLPSVPPGTWTVQFHLDRYDDLLLPGVLVTLDDGDKVVSVPPVALKLSRGGLTGRVVLEGEPAAAGVTVTLSGRPGAASTDVAGLFQLGGVPVGTYALTASRPGFDDAVLPAVTIGADLTTDAGVLTLAARPGSVAGLVVVQGAASQAGVTVRVAGTTLAGSAWSEVTSSAEDGSYLLPAVPAGQYNVSFELLDHGTVATSVAVAPDGHATLPPVTLTRNVGALLGVVQLGGVVAPFNSAGVRVIVQGTGLTTTTDGAGGFLLTGVPVGTYTVAALLPPDWQAVEVSGVTVTTGAVTTLPGSPVTLAPVASASLGGTVLLENGAAPAGTTVTLGGTDFRGVAAAAVATTGATGAFGFAGLRAGSYQLALSRPGHDAPAPLSVSVASGQAVDVGTSLLAISRGELVGQVSLEGETSAAGVTVALSGGAGAAVTDLSGAYRLPGVPVGSYVLTASRVGFGDAQLLSVTVGANQVTVVQALVLPALPGAIEGAVQVVGAADSAGVTVRADGSTLSGARWAGTTTTPASGAFLLSGVPAGTYNVTFERTDYATASTSVAVAPAATATLPPVSLGRDTGGVTGTATLQGSSDSSGLQVSLTPLPTAADPAPAPAAAAITDASGTWRVDVLPVGPYTVGYQKTGYLPQTAPVTVVSHAVVSAAPVQLAAIPGAVRGSVRLEGLAAGALGGTTVQLEGGSLSTSTLADGSYVLSGVGAGAQTVLFTRSGHDDQRVQVVLGPGDTLTLADVTLAVSRGALTGTFTLPLMASSAGVVVTAAGPGGATSSTVTGGDGVFTLAGLPVGTYTLTARKDPEWQQATVAGLVVAPAATTSAGAPVVLAPVATASLSGAVTLEGGAAGAGVLATLSGADFRGQPVSATASAGATGAFSFGGLPAGAYQVVLSLGGYDTPAPLSAALAAGQAAALGGVQLTRARGALTGTFTLPLSSSSGGVVVTATSSSGDTGTTVTDAGGAFSLTGLPVGTYGLTARKDPEWQQATVAGLVVAAGATTSAGAPVALAPVTTAGISGTVALEGGAAAAGTTATLSGADFRGAPVSDTATAGAGGTYAFTGLAAGTYQVILSRPGYETPAPLSAAVSTGQQVSLGAVSLARSRGAVDGVVLLSGVVAPSTSAGVRVSLRGTTFVALTDAAGAFSLAGVPVGTYVLDAALAPDWVGASVAGLVVARDATTTVAGSPLTLQPVATASVAGTATLEGGASPAGTTVTLDGTDFRGVAVTQASVTGLTGSYSFSGLVAGSYQVAFSRAGYETPAPLGASVGTAQAVALGGVQLARSRGAVGGVVALSGVVAPATSAGVMVALQGTAFSALTGADGSFTITGVPVGTYTVTAALPPDWQGTSVSGVVVTRDGSTTVPGSPLTLAPYATATVSGTATLEVLGAVAGTDVALAGTDFRGVAVSRTTTTAALGAFSFAALSAGSYQVTVSRTDHVTPAPAGVSVVTGQLAPLGNLALAAARGGASGTVVATGAADQSGTVVTVSGGPDAASTVTDASGAWAVSGLRVGAGYSASYQRTAYASGASLPFTVAVGATTAVAPAALALATTGSISGAVAVERGSATGVTVSLSGTDLNGAVVTRSTTSATAGAWSLTGLPHGTYGLTFTKVGYEARSLSGLAVGSSALAAATVTLPVATGTIAGNATLSVGKVAAFSVGSDHSGIVVTLSGVDVPVASAVTNSLGDYRFENVPVSLTGLSYLVTASKPWYQGQTAAVTAAAAATVVAAPMVLPVDAGGLFGLATSTNVLGGGDTLDSAGTTISVTGTAFNGTSFSIAATTLGDGTWVTDFMPPGTYDVVATATGRVCEPYARVASEPGKPTDAGIVSCLDALPPAGLVLGSPAVVPPQVTGYTAATSVTVPIVTPALDPSSPENLSGYELAVDAVPYWPKATFVVPKDASFLFEGLSIDGRNVLWARPIDLAGNVGQAVSVEVIQDSIDPDRPTLSTARPVVDATSATVTFSGSEGDANFLRYEVATATQGPTTSCALTTPSAFTQTTASTALNIVENMKTCVWGRAVDRSGRISPQAVLSVLSDLAPPSSPTIAPLYDPSMVTIHAEYADFFVTAAATDGPAGGGTAWKDVAWVEVDTGSGYRPLCPQAACRASGVFDPCGACACSDARLVCDAGVFKAVRVALLDGTGNSVGIRAVDLAGNVGSGASQVVNTATSLYEVEVGVQSVMAPRGRGRLMGYRYDNSLRLRDLGPDGRPDAGDLACDVGNLVTVVPEVAVLSPKVVVHADAEFTTEWESRVMVRRPGADLDFCTVANDDTSYQLYTLPSSSGREIRQVTGSLNSTFRSEYAAWVERGAGIDTVKVQAPNFVGILGTSFRFLPFTIYNPPAPVTLFTLPSGTNVSDLIMGGDCLLTKTTGPAFRVDCKAGGVGNATGVTTYPLPPAAFAASLSADGALLGWAEPHASGTRLHVRGAGRDKLYGTVDDTEDTRVAPGTTPWAAEAALDLGHFVLSETGTSSGTYWLQHWAAGPDGIFDDAAAADDTVALILPSSKPRESPSVLAGGVVTWGITGDGVNLADVLASDLSTYRWETIEAHGFYGLTSNDAGTLFFSRGGTLTARSPNGAEEPALTVFTSVFASSGSNLVTAEGGAWTLRRRAGDGTWFTGAAEVIYAGAVSGLAAGDQWGLAHLFSGGSRYRVSDLSQPTPTSTLLPIIPGTSPGNNGWGISAQVVAYQCMSAGWGACFHQPGADNLYGTVDDVTGVLKTTGGAGAEYGAYGLAVSGDKIAFQDGPGNLVVVAAGADGTFNTADDEETQLGSAASGSAGNIDVGGQQVTWLHIGATGGIEVWSADLRTGTSRQVTDHYSMKEQLVAEPSGRIHWVDFVFSAPAIFLSAP